MKSIFSDRIYPNESEFCFDKRAQNENVH
jgi:hypothetical protein